MTQPIGRDRFANGVSVVLPCLNEARTIGRCVTAALDAMERGGLTGEVIVADNGSTDDSRQLAAQAGARVVPVPMRGYGAALDTGIRAAQYSWVVIADSDLSYPLEEIPALIRPLAEGKADFVLGSRLQGTIAPHAMPFLNRYLGTPVLSLSVRICFGMPTSDCNSGMRAFLRSTYEKLSLVCPGMEYASEMLIRVSQRKLRYAEVPISFHPDQRGRSPHLRPWRDGWRHLRFILANASTSATFLLPMTISLVCLASAYVISLNSVFHPETPLHYHSAFLLIALATPLLLFAISILLIKTALHSTGQSQNRFVSGLQKANDRSLYIAASLFFFAMMTAEVGHLLYRWSQTNFGALSEVGAMIRIMVLTVSSTLFLSFDIGMAILSLLKPPSPSESANPSSFTVAEPLSHVS